MLEGGAPLKNVIIFFHEKNNSRDFGISFRKWPSKKKHITPHGSQQIIFLFHKGPFYGQFTWKERIHANASDGLKLILNGNIVWS